MSSSTFILPAPTDRKLRRLHCEMILHPFPSAEDLIAARNVVAERFIRDMEKQRWHWLGGTFDIEGPIPAVGPSITPSRREQTGNPSEYIYERPTLLTSEAWMYFISGNFWRELPTRTEILRDEKFPANYPKGVL